MSRKITNSIPISVLFAAFLFYGQIYYLINIVSGHYWFLFVVRSAGVGAPADLRFTTRRKKGGGIRIFDACNPHVSSINIAISKRILYSG